MSTSRYRQLDPWSEKKRRFKVLTHVVPALLNQLLKPLFSWRRVPFIIGMLLSAPAYWKRFGLPSDDAGLKEVKRTFLLVGVLYSRSSATI